MSLPPLLRMAPAATAPPRFPNGSTDMDTTADTVATIVQEKGLAPTKDTEGKAIRLSRLGGQASPKLRKVVVAYSNFKVRASSELQFQAQGVLLPSSFNHVTGRFLDAKALKYANEQFFNAQSLTLEKCPDLTDFALSMPLVRLTSLTLDNLPNCKGSSLSNFTDGPKVRLPELQHLIIRNCPLVDDISLFYIAQLLRQKLTHIEFEHLPGITAEGLVHLQREIQSFSGNLLIRSIIIRDSRLEEDSSDEGFKASYANLRDAVRENGRGVVVTRLRRVSVSSA